jgi:hypothetical protein
MATGKQPKLVLGRFLSGLPEEGGSGGYTALT